jgi:hypothetical protein
MVKGKFSVLELDDMCDPDFEPWAVCGDHGEFDTEEEAMKVARERTKKGDLVVVVKLIAIGEMKPQLDS